MTSTSAPAPPPASAPERWALDDALASLALVLMVVIPAIEVALRPLLGRGIDNAPVLVQHLGLVMAMAGALAAERHGHLTTLGSTLPKVVGPVWQERLHVYANGVSALLCGVLVLVAAAYLLYVVLRPEAF